MAMTIAAALWLLASLALAGCETSNHSNLARAATQASGATLTQSELDALLRQIGRCWSLPHGLEGVEDMAVQLRVQLRPDRTVQQVTIVDQGRLQEDATFRKVAESATRAVDRCSPLQLPPGKYPLWRDMVLNFRTP